MKTSWGSWKVLAEYPHVKVKEIRVSPNHALSFQKHEQRSEIWVVESGKGSAIIGTEGLELVPGKEVHVELLQWHQLINGGSEELVVIEIQQGIACKEIDIIRAHES